jgi:uncharacterized protein YcaQ
MPGHVPDPQGRSGRLVGWTYPQATLEHLFGRGELAVASRASNFARAYDAVERPGVWHEHRIAFGRGPGELAGQLKSGHI